MGPCACLSHPSGQGYWSERDLLAVPSGRGWNPVLCPFPREGPSLWSGRAVAHGVGWRGRHPFPTPYLQGQGGVVQDDVPLHHHLGLIGGPAHGCGPDHVVRLQVLLILSICDLHRMLDFWKAKSGEQSERELMPAKSVRAGQEYLSPELDQALPGPGLEETPHPALRRFQAGPRARAGGADSQEDRLTGTELPPHPGNVVGASFLPRGRGRIGMLTHCVVMITQQLGREARD